jgi:hypothetical protein
MMMDPPNVAAGTIGGSMLQIICQMFEILFVPNETKARIFKEDIQFSIKIR